MSAGSPQAPITTAYIKPCFIYQQEKAFFFLRVSTLQEFDKVTFSYIALLLVKVGRA
jgi:hypothetical protein